MKDPILFNKNFNKWFLNDVLRAIRRYRMIEAGEKICVALSGGKDSTTLLYILKYVTQYSPLRFDLSALHNCARLNASLRYTKSAHRAPRYKCKKK